MRRLVGVAAVLVVALVVAVGGFVVGRATADGSDVPAAGSAEVGFVEDMIDHHDQAVLMSSLALRPDAGASSAVRDVAVGITAMQRYEIGLMEGWLREWGVRRGGVGREAMAWMGHGTPVAEMPGMASASDLQRLTAATGRDFDELFFDLMREHHEGGMHMGEEAAKRADDADVKWLANLMTRNQRREIREMEAIREALRAAGG